MKRLIVTSILLVSLVTPLSACSQSDSDAIKDTATDFFNAWVDLNFSKCLNYWAASTRAEVGDSTLTGIMHISRLYNVGFDSSTATLHSLGEPIIRGSTATIWFKSENEYGSIETINLTLEKAGNHWRITQMEPVPE